MFFDRHGWIHLSNNENKVEQQFMNDIAAPIENDTVVSYIEMINVYMKTAPYSQQDFDMKTICNDLKLPMYHVEFVFRYYNQYSFPEFRNLLRVQHVLRDFESGSSTNYTMEAIGQKAGFSSRSSFFRVFKAVTGKTPKHVFESLESKNIK